MDREGLDELMSIDLETRRDAEAILFALEQAPDGFNTTAAMLMLPIATCSTCTWPSCCSPMPMASSST